MLRIADTVSSIEKNSEKIPYFAGGGNEKLSIFVDYIYYVYKPLRTVKRRCASCKTIHPTKKQATKDEYYINNFRA